MDDNDVRIPYRCFIIKGLDGYCDNAPILYYPPDTDSKYYIK